MSSLLKIQTLPPRISADFRLSKGHAVLRPYITACAGCSKLRQLAYRRPIQPHRIYGQRIHRTYVSVKPAISIECAKKNENINMVVIKDPSGNSSRDHARNISLRNEEWRKEAPLQKQKQKMQLERQKLSNILGLVAGRSTSNVLVSATVNCEKFPLSKKNMNKWLESWKVNEEIRKHVKQTGMGNPQLSELSQNQKKFLQLSKLRQEGKTCNAETLDKALAYKTLDTTLSVGHFQRDKLKAKKQFQRNKSKTQKENVRKKSLLIMKAPPIIVDTEKIGNLFRKRSPEAEISEVEEGMEKEHVVIKKSFQVPKGFESNFQQLLGYGVDGERISAELLAYTEACISIGELDVALLTLRGALHKLHNASDDMKGNRFKVEVCVFNLLLRAYAGDQARLENIYSLLETMDNAGYSEAMPDIESYAALLECHGRNTRRLTKGIPKCLEIMKSKGLDIASIFTKCKLSDESREYIVKAIRMVHEDFMPPEYADESKYSCELLENLSSKNTTRVNPYAGVVSSEELSNLLEEQLRREEEQEVEVESILTATPAQLKKIQEAMTKLAKLEEHYREVLLSAIAERRNTLNAKFNRSSVYGINMGIFLSLLTDEQYADLILKAIHYTMTDIRSQSRSSLEVRLGEMVQRKYTMEMLKQKKSLDTLKMVYRDYLKMCTSEKMDHENHREAWLSLQKQHNRENKVNEFIGQMWTFGIKKQVGHQLLTVMMESLKVETESGPVPAFTTHFRKEGFHTKESMKLNDKLLQLYRQVYKMHFDTMKLPMLVPPLPWTSTKSGGMLITPVDLVRNGYTATVEKRLEDGHNSQMFPSFDTLNTLGVCPWKVNEPILDLAIKIFRDKGDMSLGIPYLPSSYGPLPKFKKEMTQKERFEVMTQRTKMRKERSENYSIWCTELYRLSIANMFRKDIFWLPCNMDFRSRVYTIAPFLQHMGGDLTRGLLLFGKGKPLGPHGLDWLKVHLTNLTGKKKRASMYDRLDYANLHLPEIIDSADYPLEGQKWWQSSDEPWQTLACCMEIAKAVRSPNPEEYISHFPVHQDGTCNGLQHYAALGRDQAGAESVNLSPSELPRDVYSDVAEMVEKLRQADAAQGNEVAQSLEGFISRKVLKQTVMTTVYGVTNFGAMEQIRRQLMELEDFPHKFDRQASVYLSKNTFKAIHNMFHSAKQIQDWFIQSSQLVSKVSMKPMAWTTPLGFPVVQPYFKTFSYKYKSKKGANMLVKLNKPNSMKQKNAFAPNYVHSLDSSHMMLTALNCQQAGITFVSVHDCYWTHACELEVMNRICREQFVSLHSQPLLENLSQSFLVQYGISESEAAKYALARHLNHVLGNIPMKGKFDLNTVEASHYFFS